MNSLPAILQFEPILSKRVWGGTRLHTELGKAAEQDIGESWELSGVEGHISKLMGEDLDLNQLIDRWGPDLLGHKVWKQFGTKFPLLFKFIDAAQDLSVQVHPDDAYAQQHHASFGKTEMWYVMHADPGARLIMGFKEGVDEAHYLEALEAGTLAGLLKEVPVSAGDAFYIAPGTVHAIGGGILLAEIQQTSDLTYRMFDWNRMGLDGKPRQLHTAHALQVMNFEPIDTGLVGEPQTENELILKESPYFHTSLIQVDGAINRDHSGLDSFVVYMCVEGSAKLNVGADSCYLEMGQTVLVPAKEKEVVLEGRDSSILAVYVP